MFDCAIPILIQAAFPVALPLTEIFFDRLFIIMMLDSILVKQYRSRNLNWPTGVHEIDEYSVFKYPYIIFPLRRWPQG